MTRDDLLALIATVQRHQSELDTVEVKAARGGTPRVYDSLSAFANQTGGGILLFGLDEARDFSVVGVGNAKQLQEQLSDVAAHQMEPPLRPVFTVEEIEGKTVIAVEVPEISTEIKPCFYRSAGLQGGSYIRVGNTDRRMTDYEIFGYLSARAQPIDDKQPVPDATIDDLDDDRLNAYIARMRRMRPGAGFLSQPLERILEQMHIVCDVGGTLRPTLAGLLVFGKYPYLFEPQLVITFLQFYGTTEEEKAPRGERFLDNQKFDGPIPDMIENTINHVLSHLRKSSLIEGILRRDIPEYPEEAIREAVINAVAHRDYSQYVRGTYIQIRLFADRLEIQSPGGLYGNVTQETLEDAQSTRNRELIRLMEDLRLVENRGSGIRTMIAAMREASLEPPRFLDTRTYFHVTFSNLTLMNADTIAWLNQFSDHPLNDSQRLALAYLRRNQRMTNHEYQILIGLTQMRGGYTMDGRGRSAGHGG